MTDDFDELLARARDGDRQALETQFERIESRVLGLVRQRMGAAPLDAAAH